MNWSSNLVAFNADNDFANYLLLVGFYSIYFADFPLRMGSIVSNSKHDIANTEIVFFNWPFLPRYYCSQIFLGPSAPKLSSKNWT